MYDDTLISSYASFTGNINRKGKYGYLPQFMSNQEQELCVYEYFNDVDIYSKYEYVDCLNLNYDFLLSNQIIKTLSGGEKIKIQLLKLVGDEPDVLFLDEPSNDLDIETLM